MGILLLFVILILYSILYGALAQKRGSLFFAAYIVYIWIYDWLFINMSYYLPSTLVNILKLGNEFLVAFAIFILVANKIKIDKLDKSVGICFILTMIYAILISLMQSIPLGVILQGVRMFFGPVIYSYIFYKIGVFNKISIKNTQRVLWIILLTSLLYSIYQDYTFDGNLSKIWIYEYFKDIVNFDTGDFNYIRNDKLRTISFFVSPITACLFFSSISIFCASIEKNKFISFLILIIGLYGAILSRTRIGLLYFVLYLIIFILLQRRKIAYSIIAVFSAVIFTMVSLIMGITSDLSALGRLVQYKTFLEIFSFSGYGLREDLLIKFDSYIISVFLYVGIFGILILWGIISLIKYNYTILNMLDVNLHKRLVTFIIINAICIIYEFFFQYMAGGFLYKLTFLMLFVGLSYSKTIKEKEAWKLYS